MYTYRNRSVDCSVKQSLPIRSNDDNDDDDDNDDNDEMVMGVSLETLNPLFIHALFFNTWL